MFILYDLYLESLQLKTVWTFEPFCDEIAKELYVKGVNM